jgi:hypothetical protein
MLESLMKLKEWLSNRIKLEVKYERCKKLKGQQLFEYYITRWLVKLNIISSIHIKYNNI